MIDKVLQFAENDDRIVGLALGGSYISNSMDEFSDFDFVIVTKVECYEDILDERLIIVPYFGKLLSAFTGEHVGEPRLIICLYEAPLLHVDLKFMSVNDMSKRVENPIISYELNNCMADAFSKEAAVFPTPDIQWIEDRFWVWIHYVTTKLARNELFEVIDFLTFLRQTVISPLLLMKHGKLPRGVRKIEIDIPMEINSLEKTLAIHEISSCIYAIQESINLYTKIREYHEDEISHKRVEAKRIAVDYFNEISNRLFRS